MTTDYTNLITSEHITKPNYVAMVGLVANGIGGIYDFLIGLPLQFDIDVAIGIQLDLIGEWVGQSRIVPNVLIVAFFGFADNVAALKFGELTDASIGGIFWELGTSFSGTTILNDAQYRQVLYAKIASNQSDGTAAALVTVIEDIFNTSATIQDTGTLQINLTIHSYLSQLDQALITQFDLLPIPAGVGIGSITYLPS